MIGAVTPLPRGRMAFMFSKPITAGPCKNFLELRRILGAVLLLLTPCIALLCCLGCATNPINISHVTSEQQLDDYLGERVTFTGDWQNDKRGGMSNGHVTIEPSLDLWGGSHSNDPGASETVTGYLTKFVVEETSSPQLPSAIIHQTIPPGTYYTISAKRPNGNEIERHIPPLPRTGGGDLVVTTNAASATVKVEGIDAGIAGPSKELLADHLPVDPLLIEVSHEDYLPWARMVQVQDGEVTRLSVTLNRKPESEQELEHRTNAAERDDQRRPGEERIFAGIPFVWIPPGTFLMGSPEEEEGRNDDEIQHEVTLTRGFWMGKYEVTQAQWESVMGANPSSFRGNENPVDTISRYHCEAFARVLSQMGEGTFRLPTEAEWEYACRAGSTTAFSFGDSEEQLGDYAWCADNSDEQTHPVGQKLPNAWGLHDMHGNLLEWCQDDYGPYPTGPVTDPTGPVSAHNGVVRGGAWCFGSSGCRSAYRYEWWAGPDGGDDWWGFRLLRIDGADLSAGS
jgi:formylglycine-generating enzyme required for sulfatase activity